MDAFSLISLPYSSIWNTSNECCVYEIKDFLYKKFECLLSLIIFLMIWLLIHFQRSLKNHQYILYILEKIFLYFIFHHKYTITFILLLIIWQLLLQLKLPVSKKREIILFIGILFKNNDFVIYHGIRYNK